MFVQKIRKYKILCCHLLFIAKTTGRDVIEFIIQHTARRWLMTALSDENNEVLLKKIKGIEYYHKRNMTPVSNERRIR
ncbi:unnamed protein product [Blepharisma stoltei]|uniref:Uncharacterized protein n=1 Tax=Blepharisma stoltei TaxID=1481888 RepID=A0AAU9JHU5_9CILI|nr:unnamed protein product [Blepharisma stoltei]